jgi:hypothetical protein
MGGSALFRKTIKFTRLMSLALAALLAVGYRPTGSSPDPQGGGRLRDPDRGALGQPDPRGALEGQGGARHRVHLVREREVRRLRPGDARVCREGLQADHGRFLRGRADRPAGRQGLPGRGLRVRLRDRTGGAQLRGLRQLDPRTGLPLGHDCRQDDQDQHPGRGGGHADPRGEPPVQRRSTTRPAASSPSSAPSSIRPRPRKRPWPRSKPAWT